MDSTNEVTGKVPVEMTEQERAEFEAWRKLQERKNAEERLKQERESYKKLIDQNVEEVFEGLLITSQQLKEAKKKAFDTFSTAIVLKADLFKIKDDQQSHTFTNGKGNKRIIIGNYYNDSYRDTVNEGIAIVKEVASSLITDDRSRALVNAIMNLLSKDNKGNLKPSRVLQLRKMAEELDNSRLLEGIRVIEEAYQPVISKTFVMCSYKDEETNAWVPVPLGITEA